MEPQDLKIAWQSLEARMARSDQLHLAVLRDTRVQRARAALRPLKIGHWLQFALGLGLIALGVACWTRNPDVPGLLVAGIAVHAFGVLNIIGATLTLVLAARVDYAAPVLVIQRQLATLLRAYALNAAVCGVPWWILWLPVVVAFAGLGGAPAGAGTPAWITWSLAIGGFGLAGTWLYGWRQRVRLLALDANAPTRCADGTDGIRRSQRLLAEIQAFEAE
ncbi:MULTISPECIES: serine/threonine protein kinase [Luteimonas]|uniref:serine/threonine protein kinase n=1 Tax=Luteimonas TaxID=83614 RepID=UPI000C7A2D24|nr:MULTISPECIES: serine/threonine protein kinase [Luteimonas]